MQSAVDTYLSKARQWQKEMEKLRSILLACGLTEALKWGKPCYMFQESNVVVIQGFKEYCALLFFKGVLLKDTNSMLVKTGENTRVGRQIRFASLLEIVKAEAMLKTYIYQAIEIEKAGLKVDAKKDAAFVLPEEFQLKLDHNTALKTAFYALTPGRQRAYHIYFSAPKQATTRTARVEKYTRHILQGKGMND